MPDPKTPALRAPAQIIEPDKLKAAAARAQEERDRIHAAGKHEGLRLAERYRTAALIAIGFIAGLGVGGLATASLFQTGMFSASAVADRVLGRTIEAPAIPAQPLSVRDPAAEYERNAEAAREGCSPGQLMAGRRHCPPEPPSARR